jgi:hypothetical protein
MTDLSLQKGEQIRQFGKAPALASVWAFEGCPPDQFTLATYLPQTQQVRYITSLFPAHLISPLFGGSIIPTRRKENVEKTQGERKGLHNFG